MSRHGFTCRLQPEKIDAYKQYHDTVWPEVQRALKEAGVSNLSIFLLNETLFMYYEYSGNRPHEEAMAEYLTKPRIAEWEQLMGTFKFEENEAGGNGFTPMQEIFHLD